ncbi:polysaccharide deacetylase family protein [Candidatus Poribacteria bacterium]|nr:polysaccharide deacetylase family protein [Candidatus Poribacteria bacterium]
MTKLFIIITIDTEDSQDNDVVLTAKSEIDSMIFGRLESGVFGFEKIIEICDSNKVPANFFIDVCEVEKYGDDVWKEICQTIQAHGHEVELHTHPGRLYDYRREHLWEYSLSEQIEILKHGRELIKKWTNEYPVAHRAGAYGINEDTFTALKENDIPIDSSSFYSHPNCKAIITKNEIVEHNEIIEIPVTIFQRWRQVSLGNHILKQQSSIVKTDIDWATLHELKTYVRQAKANDIRIMNLFMHSYSLLKFDQSCTNFAPDWEDIEKLDKFLSFVTDDPEIRIITLKEFHQLYQNNPKPFLGVNDVPIVDYSEKFNLIQYVARRIRAIKQRRTSK